MLRKNVPLNLSIFVCFALFCFMVLSLKMNAPLKPYVNDYTVSKINLKGIYQEIRNESLQYKLCVLENLGKGVNDMNEFNRNIRPAIETCVKKTKFRNLPIHSYRNLDETKYYLHDENMNLTKSVVVTLGVGKDVIVEGALKKLLSHDSEFFAADPMLVNDAIFSPIGLFFPFAVGKTTGITTASVLTDRGTYENLQMMHIDVMTFFKRIVRREIVDMFLMDNEGPEYDIQPMLAKGREFDKAGITICQINAEFHGGFLSQMPSVLIEVFNDNRFVPIRVVHNSHCRIFMINVDSNYCVERYLANHFVNMSSK